MNSEYLDLLIKRTATLCIGASTLRNMGPAKTVAKARDFLKAINLNKFRVQNESSFNEILDEQTVLLKKFFPKGGQHWGSARKSINLFLRDAVYNIYLNSEYNLCTIEPWLEVPLDSQVAGGIRHENEGCDLPRWKGVIHLTPEMSKQYQDIANKIAHRQGINRVHLDLKYWRQNVTMKTSN